MIKSKLLGRIKAAVTCAALTVTALAVPMAVPDKEVEAAGSDNYAKLLQHSLYFYDANMCGKIGSECAIDWRGDCHTDDEVPGGFHDAGDHAMFGLPQGYAASTLLWSYYEFKDAFDATGQGAHLKVITDHFCDFFKRATKLNGDSVSAILYQKGNGDEDHGYWGAPEKQGGGRKMYWATSGASDIAAEYAAALAANYVCFGDQESLKYAEALYRFSTRDNQVVTDGPYGFYNNGGCQDEQAWAAGWLYLATKNESYKNDCGSKYNSYLGWVHGWESVDLGAACLYAEITNDWSKVNSYMQGKFSGNNYFCLDDWGSARYNCSAQMTALIATKKGNANMAGWCKNQMDYLLGNNPFNICFVTGLESNSAKNTHHRAASGYQGYDGPDGMGQGTTTYHPTNGHILIGALTGGPNTGGQYSDVMTDYQCNEVAIDYNAGLVGAAAGLYSVYKTGSVSTSIPGVSKIYNSPAPTPVETTTTTQATTTTTTTTTNNNNNNNTTASTTNNNNNNTTTTTNGGNSSSGGSYELKPNYDFDYEKLGENERMIGWKWADFGLKAGDKPTKVEVNISANGNIGKWQGAFGSSTTQAPDYWTMTDEMSESVSGNSATITWNIDSATQNIIQTQYNGEVKFGTWWVDCKQFKIDSVKVYTAGGNGNANPVTTASTQQTQQTQQTTNNNNTTTTTTVTTSNGGNSSSGGSYELKPNYDFDYEKLGEDERMIGWKWADFGLKAGDKPTKVEVNISASGTIGKWQGAFGSSTTQSPDYWTMTDEMSQNISGNSGTITWDISAADQAIIQTQYNGEVKFGTWWVDCKQFKIDSVKVYTGSGSSNSTTASTTANNNNSTTTTTKSSGSSGSSGSFELKPNYKFDYEKLGEDERMIGWKWADFGLKAGDKPTKVEVNISASGTIGKWQGAFGSSTTQSPDYWTMTDEMSQNISGNSGTITWDISAADQAIIQTQYNGEVKFGTWWVDCKQFTIDSVKVYTAGGSSSSTTASTTKATTTTTTTTTTTKATTTTASTAATTTTTKKTTSAAAAATKYGDVNCDGKVNVTDVVALNMYLLNKSANPLDKTGIANADCKKDDVINTADATLLMNFVAELVSSSELGK